MYEELSKLAGDGWRHDAGPQSVATPPNWESFELASGNFQPLNEDGYQSPMRQVWVRTSASNRPATLSEISIRIQERRFAPQLPDLCNGQLAP